MAGQIQSLKNAGFIINLFIFLLGPNIRCKTHVDEKDSAYLPFETKMKAKYFARIFSSY